MPETITWPMVAMALIVAIPGIIAGIISIIQARKTHGLVNSKMNKLLEVTKVAATLTERGKKK